MIHVTFKTELSSWEETFESSQELHRRILAVVYPALEQGLPGGIAGEEVARFTLSGIDFSWVDPGETLLRSSSFFRWLAGQEQDFSASPRRLEVVSVVEKADTEEPRWGI